MQQMRDEIAEQWRTMRREEGAREARLCWRTEKYRTRLFYTEPEYVSPFWAEASRDHDEWSKFWGEPRKGWDRGNA
jgi:hypothetical protein